MRREININNCAAINFLKKPYHKSSTAEMSDPHSFDGIDNIQQSR